MTHTIDDWKNCYPSNWKGLIIPEAMSHPAKFSSRLIRRIYEHMKAEGWLRIGDTVIDPFGGVGLGALEAMRHGLNWYGSELEQKFVDLGQQNIDSWNTRFSTMPHWGRAVLLQGDSRKLIVTLNAHFLKNPGTAAISSPPYADSDQNYKGGWDRFHKNHDPLHENDIQREAKYGNTPGQLSEMPPGSIDLTLSSPPYAAARIGQESGQGHCGRGDQYGETPGQLGAMGDEGFSSVINEDLTAKLSSPPYIDTDVNYRKNGLKENGGENYTRPYMEGQEDDYGPSEGQLSAMQPGDISLAISSPPFRQSTGGINDALGDPALMARHAAGNSAAEGYGSTEGNLANMDEPSGDFKVSISSPPFKGQSSDGGWQMLGKYAEEGKLTVKQVGGDPTKSYPSWDKERDTSYGHTDGQLADLPEGEIPAAAISSPPYEKGTEGVMRADKFKDPAKFAEMQRHTGNGASFEAKMRAMEKDNERAEYGDTEGNIGNDQGETFWSAARTIVEQVYLALAPGGHAVWVVKDFVKNKERVPFSDQWRQLCEAVGFVTLHEHHALLVHHKGASHTLEGGTVEHKTESKSFFRRLAEKKGSPKIDFEVVYCMVKQWE